MRARIVITTITLGIVTTGLAGAAGAAAAGPGAVGAGALGGVTAHRPARAAGPAPNVSSAAMSSWQTNGMVRKIAYAGGFIYAGGTFTGEMPPGSTTVSGHQGLLARFGSKSGTFDSSFNPVFTDTVPNSTPDITALTVAGSTLYVGGHFTDVAMGGGVPQPRSYGAAFDLTTNPPTLLSWNPKANGAITTIAVASGTAYLGGAFSTLGGQARNFAGAVDAATGGTVLAWAPAVDKLVTAIRVARGGGSVLVGGNFSTFNGQARQGIGSTDPTNGTAVNPWPNILPSSPTVNSQVTDIIIPLGSVSSAHPDGIAYVSAQGVGRGNFDGSYAADVATGAELWENDCFGDTQALLLLGGWLYKASHASDCNYAPAGFPPVLSVAGKLGHHLLSLSPADGSLGFWNPGMNGGPTPGDLGAFAFATDGSAVFVGGVFSRVNNRQQEGIAIFDAKPAGKKDGTPAAAPPAPAAVSTARGVVSVSVAGVSDHDNGLLTYKFYRNGTLAGTRTKVSWPWALPLVHFRDAGRVPGRVFHYTVKVCDPTGTCSPFSPRSNKVTVAARNPIGYIKRVLLSKPSFLWRLSETSGRIAFDAAKHGYRGIYEHGTTHGVRPGPIGGTTAPATGFAGGTTSGGMVTARKAISSPSTFSIELWFKTGTKAGGELAGFSSVQTGIGGSFDRQIWMTNGGHLAFAVHGHGQVILSSLAYNDNAWHHVVATFSPATGLALYVDGLRVGINHGSVRVVYRGFWRVGGGDLTGWSLDGESNARPVTAPNHFFITADIADVAVYPTVLTARQVAKHWAANFLSH